MSRSYVSELSEKKKKKKKEKGKGKITNEKIGYVLGEKVTNIFVRNSFL